MRSRKADAQDANRLQPVFQHGIILRNAARSEETTRGDKSMANIYIEARPKGRPEGSPSRITWSRTMRTTCFPLSRRSARQSSGHAGKAIILSSLVSGGT